MNAFRFKSAIILCLFFATPAFSFDSLFIADEYDHIFGKGVHAFFDKNYKEAIAVLSKAEELNIEDPRPYYFLGLAYLRQDEGDKAEQHIRKAAQLEFSGRALRDYGVSESLRRIQGVERARLETIRAEERANSRIREQRMRAARYGSENAAARNALRQSLSAPADISDLEANGILAENVFGLRPIDPVALQEGGIIAQRTDANPFGTVTSIDEIPQLPDTNATTPASYGPAPLATPTGRTFVNVDVAPTQRTAISGRGESAEFIRNAQTEAARQAGKMLGTLFSGKSD